MTRAPVRGAAQAGDSFPFATGIFFTEENLP